MQQAAVNLTAKSGISNHAALRICDDSVILSSLNLPQDVSTNLQTILGFRVSLAAPLNKHNRAKPI